MAGYGDIYKGYYSYGGARLHDDDQNEKRYASDYGYDGVTVRGKEWNDKGYDSDHVCRPVDIDADGRKQPIVYGYSTGGYVIRTEVVEHVQPRLVASGYRHTSPTKVEPLRSYGVVEDKWGRPTSPVHDRPQKVEEFITRVQSEASRPSKPFAPLNATYWRNISSPTATGHRGNSGYGNYRDSSNKEWQQPIRNANYDDMYQKNDSVMEPGRITTGGWSRPSHETWSSPPDSPVRKQPAAWPATSEASSLSKPTSDIGTAMEYLKEAARPVTTAPQPSRSTVPISTGPKRDAYTEDIDSSVVQRPTSLIDKAKGYLKEAIKPTSVTTAPQPASFTEPISTGPKRDSYSETVDSREAQRPASYVGTGKEYLKQAARPTPGTTAPQPARFTEPISTGPKKDSYSEAVDSREAQSSTGNVGMGKEYLKQAARPTSVTATPQPERFAKPISNGPRSDSYTETIDSTEARRRYGSLNSASMPVETYTETINSREAARRYGGATVPKYK